jgi:tRNA(fMet)-specific endonuclease VapC
MKYLLDTDHISILQRQMGTEYAILSGKISRLPLSEFAFSIVSFHEQALGCHAYLNRARNTQDVVRGYFESERQGLAPVTSWL